MPDDNLTSSEFTRRRFPIFDPADLAARRKVEIEQKDGWDAENIAAAIAKAEVGGRLPDGSIYAGISPDTQKRIYTTYDITENLLLFETAQNYASKLAAHGHKDWRLPTKGELNVLFNNRADVKGFRRSSGEYSPYFYLSYDPDKVPNHIALLCFADGRSIPHSWKFYSLVRCVRG